MKESLFLLGQSSEAVVGQSSHFGIQTFEIVLDFVVADFARPGL